MLADENLNIVNLKFLIMRYLMKTFYFFGDSITLGVNVTICDSWTGLVNIYLKSHGLPIPPTTFYNLGARKHSTKSIEARFESEFKARNLPESESYFIIMCGTVDMAAPTGTPVLKIDLSIEYLEKLLTKAKSLGKCLFLSPPPVKNEDHSNRIADLAQEQEKLCQKLDIDYINLHQVLSSTYPNYIASLEDGIHPQEMGNVAISEIICKSQTFQNWIKNNG